MVRGCIKSSIPFTWINLSDTFLSMWSNDHRYRPLSCPTCVISSFHVLERQVHTTVPPCLVNYHIPILHLYSLVGLCFEVYQFIGHLVTLTSHMDELGCQLAYQPPCYLDVSCGEFRIPASLSATLLP